MVKLQKNSLAKSLNIKNFFNDDHISFKRTAPKFPNSILSELPYDYYDQTTGLFHNLLALSDEKKYEETCGFLLNGYLKSGINREDIKLLSDFFNSSLPEGSIVQIINYASPRYRDLFDNWIKNKKKEGGIYNRLAEKRVDFFNKGAWDSFFDEPLTIKDYHLYIAVSISKKIKNYNQKLISLREKFTNKLKNINLYLNNSDPEILLAFLDEILNPSRNKFRKSNIKWDKLNSINSSLVAGSDSVIKIEYDKVILRDDIESRSFTASSYPEFWAAFNMIELSGSEDNSQLRINCPSIISLTIKIPNQEKQKISIIQRKELLSSRFHSKARSLWMGIEEQYKDYKYVTEKIEKDDNKNFQTKFDVILICPKENLEYETEKLRSIYKTKNWEIIQNNYVHFPTFLSSLPFYTNLERFDLFSKIGKTKKIISWTSTNIAPMQGEYRGNAINDPYLILFGKRGQPIFWNPFISGQGGNFNIATSGIPGSGKSVISQEIAIAARSSGARVFIIDNGKSFKNSTLIQGAKFIDIADKISVNPFTMFDLSAWNQGGKEGQDYQNDIINFLTHLLCQISRPIKEEPITTTEKSLIEIAVRQTINEHMSKSSFRLVSENLIKIVKNEQQKIIAENLQLPIIAFLDKYEAFFTGKSDITLESMIMVFEMASLEGQGMDDIKSVIMMIIMHLISEMIYKSDRSKRQLLIIDEAWSLMEGGNMGSFMRKFIKRVRKFNGLINTITQDIPDFFINEASKALFTNSNWKIFMQADDSGVNYLKKNSLLNFNSYSRLELDLRKLRVSKGKYSETLIYGKDGYFTGRLVMDPFSIFLYSSSASDFVAINDLKKQGLSTEDAIEKLIENQNNA